jgi:hypothetical protein
MSERELKRVTATGGGPLDGTEIPLRRPKGVLAVDRAARRAWVYDLEGDALVCRQAAGEELVDAGRYKAAEDGQYDVLAVRE